MRSVTRKEIALAIILFNRGRIRLGARRSLPTNGIAKRDSDQFCFFLAGVTIKKMICIIYRKNRLEATSRDNSKAVAAIAKQHFTYS